MMNNNNDNDNNRIELIGLNEFIQDDKDNIELDWGVDEDERPFPDSDEAIRALQDDAEDAERLRAELVTALAERDAARREICELRMPCVGSQRGYAKGRGWDCYKEESK